MGFKGKEMCWRVLPAKIAGDDETRQPLAMDKGFDMGFAAQDIVGKKGLEESVRNLQGFP